MGTSRSFWRHLGFEFFTLSTQFGLVCFCPWRDLGRGFYVFVPSQVKCYSLYLYMWSHSVALGGLELTDPSASASSLLEFKVRANTQASCYIYIF